MKNPFQYYVLLIGLLRIGYFFIPQILNIEHFFLFICLIFLPVVMHLQCFVVSHVAWNQECDIYHEARSYKCQVLTLPLDNFRIRICIFTDIPQKNKANDLADCETLVFYVKRRTSINH